MLSQVIQSLEILPPLELQAVSLLATLRTQTGEWFPSPPTPETRAQVIAATSELVAYTQRCADLGRRLAQLEPVPLPCPLLEFGQ